MFQERNEELLKPHENEYFFDRNGKAFHYIMEYYRNGKIFWLEGNNNFITRQELKMEIDFFQISFELPKSYYDTTSSTLLLHRKSFPQVNDMLKDFIGSLKSCIYESGWNLREDLDISFYSYINSNYNECTNSIESIENILKPFKSCGYKLLNKFKSEIEDELKKSVRELIKLEIVHKSELISVIRRPPHYSLNFKIQKIL